MFRNSLVFFDTLEPRMLLSGTTVSLVSGVLTINGTGGDDIIRVITAPGVYRVQEGTRAGDNVNYKTLTNAVRSKVKKIWANGRSGSDNINIATDIFVKTELFGADGDDFIYGGGGEDKVHGNTGDDSVLGRAGNDRIFGDDGDDGLFGGKGNDMLFGDGGVDACGGNGGSDIIDVNDNDLLDIVRGGKGFDTVIFDKGHTDWDKTLVEVLPKSMTGCENFDPV